MSVSDTAVDEACELVTDGTHYTPPDVGAGMPFLTVKDFSHDGVINLQNCSLITDAEFRRAEANNSVPIPGDVLFSKDGTVGKVYIVKSSDRFAVLSSLAILRPDPLKLNSKYFSWALRSDSCLRQATRKKTGSAIRRIILKDLKRVRFPLPPLPEQKRIAAILDAADALRAKRRESIEQLDSLIQSTFLEMFGDPVTNPKGWDVQPLDGLTSKVGSGATPRGGNAVYKSQGISLIRSMNVHDGDFCENGLAYIDKEQAARLSNVEVEADDVLLNITGASVARVCRAPVYVLPARVNQHVCIIRTNQKLSPVFLEQQLLAQTVKRKLLNIGATGATRQAITKAQVLGLLVMCPPFEIQTRFASIVESIEQQKTRLKAHLVELDTLFASLQSRAFNGELVA